MRSAAAIALIGTLVACGGGGGDDEPAGATRSTVAVAPTSAGPGPGGRWWRPAPGLTWQWQLSGPVDTSVEADVFDVDLFDVDAATVAELHQAGRRVICYLSAGSHEDWRPDAGRFPAEVIGAPLEGWPGERWLDVRRLDVLGPILAERLDLCRSKGFDAVEPDNLDAYQNTSGFPLAAGDQARFNRMVADLAHERDLAVGLKNDVDQATELEPWFDFAVNEECVRFDECTALGGFVTAGKAVFHVEYDLPAAEFCPVTVPLGFSSMAKRLDLDAWREPCPPA